MATGKEGWVTVDDWCERYKELPTTVHKRIQEGAWARGELASCPDGTIMFVHEEKCKSWCERRGKLKL